MILEPLGITGRDDKYPHQLQMSTLCVHLDTDIFIGQRDTFFRWKQGFKCIAKMLTRNIIHDERSRYIDQRKNGNYLHNRWKTIEYKIEIVQYN